MAGLDWADLFTDLDKLTEDYLRGVKYPVHLAYNDVQSLYKDSFHILDPD
jgi:hypothetical protein